MIQTFEKFLSLFEYLNFNENIDFDFKRTSNPGTPSTPRYPKPRSPTPCSTTPCSSTPCSTPLRFHTPHSTLPDNPYPLHPTPSALHLLPHARTALPTLAPPVPRSHTSAHPTLLTFLCQYTLRYIPRSTVGRIY